ncbi:tetratricopeptide repeat protein [Oceanobacillus salinisoli]|uniref:tetratricopeptide repeat protein n=1 Tax=Oceanobacillus salinisoli TaxID=2678611 RepID=UPI0012E13652|nr:tetratricopeptide repeat protein [Oceanobacillus salinisoli]
MPIQPKFQIGRQNRQYITTKKFTDRELPRKAFFEKLNDMKQRTEDQAYDVLMYYGVGGIGKSSLMKQLKLELKEAEPNAVYTSIDLKDTTFHHPARALLELVREVRAEQKIKFPHFEIAYSIYFYKRNPDISYNEKKLPFEKELDIMGTIVSTLDGMGIAGTVSGIVGKIYDSKKNWSLDKEVKSYLKELENNSVQEIEEQLIAFFAYDLQKAIAKHHIPSTIIFLDTFEALWSGLSNKTTVHTKDKWVRDLIGSLPNVLFVICGREYLEWEKYDADWKEIIHHHMIENLGYEDAASFLEHCGIEEKAIRDKMIDSSGGYPYHLDLSVDTYFEMKNRGETMDVDRFGSNQREILDRFLQYLTDYEIETLKIMSIPRFYNRDVFEHLLTKHPTGYSITKYDDFNKFSFITKEFGKLFIHSLMRQGMLAYTSDDLVQMVHETVAAYYRGKFEVYRESGVSKGKEMQAFAEYIFHKKAALDQQEFVDWLAIDCLEMLRKLQLRGESRFLRETLGDLHAELGAKALGIGLTQILVDMVHLNGEYDAAISIIDEYLEDLSTKEILASPESAHLAVRKVHHQMFSKPVDGLIAELLNLEPELATKNWPNEYNELLFMIGGNLGVLSGDLQLSRKWLVTSIRYAEKHNQLNYHCRALRKYVDVLKINGHLKWAKEFCEKGIKIAQAGGYERYESILVCTLADVYRMEGKFDIAEELLDKAMEMIKKVGIKGWIGHIHSTYAEMLFQKGAYQEAAQKWQETLSIYKELGLKWGLIIGNIGLERCYLKGADIETKEPIHYWQEEAERLNYRREVELIEELGRGELAVLPLAYL